MREVSAAGGNLAELQCCNVCSTHCLTAMRLGEIISSPSCFLSLWFFHVWALPVEACSSAGICAEAPVLPLLRGLFISSCAEAVACSK